MPKEFRRKLDPKSEKCVFLGYGESGEMGYRLWDLESHKIICSHDVVFSEKKMQKKPRRDGVIRRVAFRVSIHLHMMVEGKLSKYLMWMK